MSIEFRCTGCGKLLRTADDSAGRQAQCPACGTVVAVGADAGDRAGGFAPSIPLPHAPGSHAVSDAPVNPFQAPSDPGTAPILGAEPRSRVAGPAIALMVTAILSATFQAMSAILVVVRLLFGNRDQMTGDIFRIGLFGFGLVCSIVAFYGALKMRSLESYSLAMTSAILSIIPCISSACCILGLPFGIWALVVISNREVRDAFKR
jgi:hypothetical protein